MIAKIFKSWRENGLKKDRWGSIIFLTPSISLRSVMDPVILVTEKMEFEDGPRIVKQSKASEVKVGIDPLSRVDQVALVADKFPIC